MKAMLFFIISAAMPSFSFSQKMEEEIKLENIIYSIFSDYYGYDLCSLNVVSSDSTLDDQDSWRYGAIMPLYEDSTVWEFIEVTYVPKVLFNRTRFEKKIQDTCGRKKKEETVLWFESSNYFILGGTRYFIYIDHAVGGEMGESALYEFNPETYVINKVYEISIH